MVRVVTDTLITNLAILPTLASIFKSQFSGLGDVTLIDVINKTITILRQQHRHPQAVLLSELSTSLRTLLPPQWYANGCAAIMLLVRALVGVRLSSLSSTDLITVLTHTNMDISTAIEECKKREGVCVDVCHHLQVRRLLAGLASRLQSLHTYCIQHLTDVKDMSKCSERVKRMVSSARDHVCSNPHVTTTTTSSIDYATLTTNLSPASVAELNKGAVSAFVHLPSQTTLGHQNRL